MRLGLVCFVMGVIVLIITKQLMKKRKLSQKQLIKCANLFTVMTETNAMAFICVRLLKNAAQFGKPITAFSIILFITAMIEIGCGVCITFRINMKVFGLNQFFRFKTIEEENAFVDRLYGPLVLSALLWLVIYYIII